VSAGISTGITISDLEYTPMRAISAVAKLLVSHYAGAYSKTRKGGICYALQLEGRRTSRQWFWAVFGTKFIK